MGLDVPVDFSETESISIKTWSPKADIPVRLKLEVCRARCFYRIGCKYNCRE